MALLNFQLKALGYPHSVDLTIPESGRKLVIWLENLKIREYKIEDRKALADTQSQTWDAAFQKYLQDLECPVPSSDMTAALHWLVAFSVNLEYEDNADKFAPGGGGGGASLSQPSAAGGAGPGDMAAAAGPGAAAAGPVSAKHSGALKGVHSSRDDEDFNDLYDPRVVEAVLQLIKAARVSEGLQGGSRGCGGAASLSSASVVDQLMAAAQRCVCEVGPALKPGVWTPGRPPNQALAGVPLGFEVEAGVLSTAATALRLLYIQDLRRLQSQIDHAIVEMQEYTANPKTDSSLGKVGR